MDSFWELQTGINLFFQSLGTWLEIPMRLFTFLGEEQFFMLVMPAFYWCVDAALGLRLGIILLTSSTLNGYLKLAFHTPRPYWINPEVKAFVHEPSFGLPSGHSQNSASMWGRMAAASSKRWQKSALILLVGMIGLSRLFLGVHSISDVLTGWLAGFVLLFVFLKIEKPAAAFLGKLSLARQVLLVFLFSLLLIGIYVFIRNQVYLSWILPELWYTNSSLAGSVEPLDPFSIKGVFSGAGTLFGLLTGAAWLRYSGGFSAAGSGWRLIARYIFGLAGILVIWFGLDQVFPDGEMLLALSLRYIRYMLVGLWVSGAAPWLFMRFGWAVSPQGVGFRLPEMES